MATLISHSPAETASLGERWGRIVRKGIVFGLCGDLGAGKTQLVRGFAKGLGTTARVHSPTFTLVNEYGGGRLRLFHLDLYRLENAGQAVGAGLEGFLQPEGVTLIEWPERWFGSCPGPGRNKPARSNSEGIIWIRMEIVSETERRIEYDDFGA